MSSNIILLFKKHPKNRLTDIENKLMVKGKKWGRNKLGVWDQHIYPTIYKIGKQQGPTV